MAIHLIIFGLLKILKSDLLPDFMKFPVQLLNFAVLLSYPINFFIYCRMSRAFRDAFTKLLCPSWNETREDPVLTTQSQYNTKAATYNNNNKNNNNGSSNNNINNNNDEDEFELNDTKVELNSRTIGVSTSTTVILNAKATEPLGILKNSRTDGDIYGKHTSNNPSNKQDALFHQDLHKSMNRKYTDL